jgi:hypothetical protein
MAVSIPVVIAAVVWAIAAVAVLVTVAGVGSVAASLVAAFVIGDALVIGDASYRAAGVSPYNADEGVRAVGVAARIGAKGAEGQSARDEKSGKRSLDRWTHDKTSLLCSSATALIRQSPPNAYGDRESVSKTAEVRIWTSDFS